MSAAAVLEAARARAERVRAPLGGSYPFESRFLDLDGLALHYLDEGPRAAEPLLFVHGNPTWSFFWRQPIAAFRSERRCVAPDHIGCGLSDKPEDWRYVLAGHVANLERLVLALDLTRITLVVHDWGGAIGLGLAGRHPERFARLVITNTAAFPLERCEGARAPWRILVCRTPGLGEIALLGFNAFARAATTLAVARRPLDPEARRGLLAPYDSWASRVATLAFVRDIPLSPAHPSWATLAEIDRSLARLAHLPALIVWGERDWCFTPAFRREWERRFPRAAVRRLDAAGHYLLEDAGEEVVAAIAEFLEEHPL